MLFILHRELIFPFHLDSLSLQISFCDLFFQLQIYRRALFLFLKPFRINFLFIQNLRSLFLRLLDFNLLKKNLGFLFLLCLNDFIGKDNLARIRILFGQLCFDLLDFLLCDRTLRRTVQKLHLLDFLLELFYVVQFLVDVGS